MSCNDGRDFSPEYSVTFDADAPELNGARVEIEKLGGGTLGEAYEGTWRYRVTYPSGDETFGQDLVTGTPKTHSEAVNILWEFLTPDLS